MTNKHSLLTNTYLNLVMLGLPIVITDGYFNITETKSAYFISISCLFVMLSLILSLVTQIRYKNDIRSKIKISELDLAMLLFLFFYLVSAMLSAYKYDVWIGANSRYQGALTVFLYGLVYFVVSRNYNFSHTFLWCSLIAFSIVCIIGVLNCFDISVFRFYEAMDQRYKKTYISTIGNINFYSSYICLIFPMIVCGFCQTKKRISQIAYTIFLIIGSFGMMVTSSDSFSLGFGISMLIIPLFMFNDIEKIKKYFLAVIIIIINSQVFKFIYNLTADKNIVLSKTLDYFVHPLVMAALCIISSLFLYLLYKRSDLLRLYKNTYISLLLVLLLFVIACFIWSNTVGIGRLDNIFKITSEWGTYRGGIWRQMLELYKSFDIREKFFGIGPESIYNLSHPLEIHGNKNLDQAHNEYLQYLLTIGMFGLLSYITLIITTAVMVLRKIKDNNLAVSLLVSLIAYWAQAAVNIAQPFTTPIMFVFVACIGGMLYDDQKSFGKLHR